MGSTNQYFDILFGEGDDEKNLTAIIEKYRGGVTNIDRGVGSQWINTSAIGTDRYGNQHAYQKLGSKSIKINFIIFTDIAGRAAFRREMASAIDCPKGSKKLRFEDEPNGYYNAVTTGTIALTENLSEESASGSLTFDVPDGLWHSDTGASIRSTDTDGSVYGSFSQNGKVITANINNPSNVTSYPTIRIKHKSQNGWIGIVNQNGVSEFGNKTANESGYKNYTGEMGSEVLIRVARGDNSFETGWGGWKDGLLSGLATNLLTFDSDIVQRLNINSVTIEGYRYRGITPMNNVSRQTTQKWSEGLIYKDLPADRDGKVGAVDFRVDFNAKFHALRLGQVGSIRVGIVDKDNKMICNYELIKDDPNGNVMIVAFILGDRTYTWRSPDFHANDGEYEPANSQFNKRTGDAYFQKEGGRFTFLFKGTPYTLHDERLKNVEAKRIVIQMGRHTNKNDQVPILFLESLSFTKLNVPRFDQVANRYKPDSILTIDNFNGEVRISPDGSSEKGYRSQGEMVLGSSWVTIPPGHSKMEFHFSDWIEDPLPEVEIDFNENYLQ